MPLLSVALLSTLGLMPDARSSKLSQWTRFILDVCVWNAFEPSSPHVVDFVVVNLVNKRAVPPFVVGQVGQVAALGLLFDTFFNFLPCCLAVVAYVEDGFAVIRLA